MLRRAAQLEPEDTGTLGVAELAVRGRDLEVRRLGAGIRLERQPLEPEALVDREVGDPGEVMPLVVRDRAVVRQAEVLVFFGAEVGDGVGIRDVLVARVVVFVMLVVVVRVLRVVRVVVVRVLRVLRVLVLVVLGHFVGTPQAQGHCRRTAQI